MTRFPTERHLANWAGLAPGNNERAGKRHSGRTDKANARSNSTNKTLKNRGSHGLCNNGLIFEKHIYYRDALRFFTNIVARFS